MALDGTQQVGRGARVGCGERGEGGGKEEGRRWGGGGRERGERDRFEPLQCSSTYGGEALVNYAITAS